MRSCCSTGALYGKLVMLSRNLPKWYLFEDVVVEWYVFVSKHAGSDAINTNNKRYFNLCMAWVSVLPANVQVKGRALARPSERSEWFEPLVRLALEPSAVSDNSTIANIAFDSMCCFMRFPRFASWSWSASAPARCYGWRAGYYGDRFYCPACDFKYTKFSSWEMHGFELLIPRFSICAHSFALYA